MTTGANPQAPTQRKQSKENKPSGVVSPTFISNRQIAESYGLTQTQIEQLVNRQNRKRKKLEAGIIIRPKGRPPKTGQTPEAVQEQEVRQLRMTVELLRNFLSEAGRR